MWRGCFGDKWYLCWYGEIQEHVGKQVCPREFREILVVECDHDWQVVDESFDHEYGREKVVFVRCQKCDLERDYEPQYFDDDVL